MRLGWTFLIVGVLLLLGIVGCQSQISQLVKPRAVEPISGPMLSIDPVAFEEEISGDDANAGKLEPLPPPASNEAEIVSPELLSIQNTPALSLDEVVRSVRSHFPLVHQAIRARGIASGEALSAEGAFDHKLEGFTRAQPLDFYENYRHAIGVKRDTMWGGRTFAGYRLGRGVFEPWYNERETNKGGEFKAGLMAPLVRDRWIDANRAALWQAQLERRRVEPEIMAQIIQFVRDGSVAYWNWVAAGEIYQVASDLLKLAQERNKGLQEQVKAQEKAKIDLVDNRRIIVSREAKLIDARRKLQQASVKLSLFYRSDAGDPVLAESVRLPAEFSQMALQEEDTLELGLEADDIRRALVQRPDLAELQIVRAQLDVALRQAKNETWPDVDGGLAFSQDVGDPANVKRDKLELQLEALVTVSVPLERRKALGKIRSLRWKLSQLTAKSQFTSDKIVADVRLARVALVAANERVSKASESYELTVQMQAAGEELFNQGQNTLFNLNIREQQTAEAAIVRVQALFDYFVAKADYLAAMGYDGPNI